MSTEERAVALPATATRKWINAGPDDGALYALLDRVAERVPRERIDLLWIFPQRIVGGVESTVIVVAAFDADPERHTVATAHFRVSRDKRGRATVTLQMQEHGTAPAGATQRVVDGVLRRMGDEVGRDAPRREEIGGSLAAWQALYLDVGGAGAEDSTDDAAVTPPHGDAVAGAPDGTASDAPDGGGEPIEDGEEQTPPHGDTLADAVER